MVMTAPEQLSNIFAGVIIHVNGDTQPKSKDELCEIVAQVHMYLLSGQTDIAILSFDYSTVLSP
jgi:hypothetical protein